MKILHKINTFLNWIFDPAVKKAINDGLEYEEVQKIAEGRKEENNG